LKRTNGIRDRSIAVIVASIRQEERFRLLNARYAKSGLRSLEPLRRFTAHPLVKPIPLKYHLHQ